MTPFAKNAMKMADDRWISWSDWKIRWKEAYEVSGCVALLHYGFQTRVETPWEEAERLSFYLRLAYGKWTRAPRFPSEAYLADKAASVLAIQFSKEEVLCRRLPSFPPVALAEVLRYFRVGEYKSFDEVQYGFLSFKLSTAKTHSRERDSRDHENDRISKALVSWCMHLWRGEFEPSQYSQRTPSADPRMLRCLQLMRPNVITLLNACGELERLLEPAAIIADGSVPIKITYKVCWDLFDNRCMRRLEKLALRQGATINEALLAGSSAAMVWQIVTTAQESSDPRK